MYLRITAKVTLPVIKTLYSPVKFESLRINIVDTQPAVYIASSSRVPRPPRPAHFVLQATKAGRGGLGTRLYSCEHLLSTNIRVQKD